MFITGLKNINKDIADEEAKFERRKNNTNNKINWFKLADGQSVRVVFLNELDEDSPHYSKKNGLGVLSVEHSNPKDFKRKALCTASDGECWACEQHAKDYKAKWGQKRKLNINVLVDDGKNEKYVAVLSQGFGAKSITPNLLEYATLVGSITDKNFSIKRTGSDLSNTSYTLTPLNDNDVNVEDYELFDLSAVTQHVVYAEQEAHYTSSRENVTDSPKETQPAWSSSKSDDDDW